MVRKRYDEDYKVQAVNLAKEIGLNHKPKRKPNGITKADREARKSDILNSGVPLFTLIEVHSTPTQNIAM